jgi:transposase
VVLGDRGYDHDKYRRVVWDLGVKPLIARRGTEHGSGLGTQRWVVERAFAHLHWFRRLRIRWEICGDNHEALHPRMRTDLLATPEPSCRSLVFLQGARDTRDDGGRQHPAEGDQ